MENVTGYDNFLIFPIPRSTARKKYLNKRCNMDGSGGVKEAQVK